MKRIYNFSGGPAQLPIEVIERAREDLLSYRGSGIGIMEMSHRDPRFDEILNEAKGLIVKLMGVPANYSVLFTTGGATNQFSMIPMNLLDAGRTADYIISGVWAEKAAEEAVKFGHIHIAGTSKAEKFRFLPKQIELSANPAYVHFTSNNTIVGTQFRKEPDSKGAPLVCDASSDICSRVIDVSKYGVIYAGAQKNLGGVGVTAVIIRNDLLATRPRSTPLPIMQDYRTYSEHNSLYNTAPTFAIYMVRELLTWLEKKGGVAAIEKLNEEKAQILYSYLDKSDFYSGCCEKDCRSRMNITFTCRKSELERTFLVEAEKAGLSTLAGHRMLGGFRASMYNAMPKEGAEALVGFMDEFAKRNA